MQVLLWSPMYYWMAKENKISYSKKCLVLNLQVFNFYLSWSTQMVEISWTYEETSCYLQSKSQLVSTVVTTDHDCYREHSFLKLSCKYLILTANLARNILNFSLPGNIKQKYVKLNKIQDFYTVLIRRKISILTSE